MKEFRYDIGALRALAVILVILYHFHIPFFGGGFIGVDVFFVISGFLMTKIILSGFDRDNFSFWEFYLRRAKRIIPPLLILSFVILILSYMIFLDEDLKQNSRNTLVSSVFLSNVFYWLNTSYFAPDSKSNIFLHSWSLSVEWQFYLLYPLLLLPFKKLYLQRKRTFLQIFLITVVLCFLLSIFSTFKDQSFSFYMFPTRAWEMLLGGCAFLFRTNSIQKEILKNTVVVLSFLTIVFCGILFSETMNWPSYLTLLPVLATFNIILLKADWSFLQKRFVQLPGDISYELYLWHWPVYVSFAYFSQQNQVIMIVLITVILSYFFYYCFVNFKILSSNKAILLGYLAVIPLSFYGFKASDNFIAKSINVYPEEMVRLNAEVNKYFENDRIKQFNSCGCFIAASKGYTIYNIEKCLKIEKSKKNYVLLGDSHAAQFSQSFREKFSSEVNLLEVSAGYTFPFRNPRGNRESVALIENYYQFFDNNSNSIDKVIVSVHWLMNNNKNLNYSSVDLQKNILSFIEDHEQKGVRIYIIGQSEQYQVPFSRVVLSESLFGKRGYNSYLNKSSAEMNEFLKTVIPEKNYIDIYNMSFIHKYENNSIYMADNNHFTKMGADQVVDVVLRKISK